MTFDVQAAKQAGYSDQEIADYLASQNGFDASGARKAGYSDQEIASHLVSQTPEPGYVPGLSEGMNTLSQVPRQLGLTVRAGLGGLGGVANMVLDPATALVNKALAAAQPTKLSDLVTGQQPFQLPLPSQAMERTLSRFLPTPDTPMERIAQAGARAMVPVAGSVQAGRTIPALASLAELPGTQLFSAASGGASSQGAAEAGMGPGGQALAGILGGVGGPTALAASQAMARAALRVPGSLLAPFTGSGQLDAAARLYQSSATNRPAALDALGGQPQLTKAQQAYRASLGYAPAPERSFQLVPGTNPLTAEVANDTGLSGLYKNLLNNPQTRGPLQDTLNKNDAARQAFLAQQFGTPADLIMAKAARESSTGPMREQALNAANQTGQQILGLDQTIAQRAASKAQALQQAGQMATGAAEQNTFANSFTPVPGMPRVPASLSPNLENVPIYQAGAQDAARIAAQRQAELEAARAQRAQIPYAPLQSAPIIQSIEGALNVPGIRSSDVASKTLADVSAKLAKFTDQNGLIDANDLYTIRKELGNTIETHAKASNNWDKRMTAGLERNIQGAIDSSIVNSGGTAWPQYLQAYKNASAPIDNMQLGQDITKAATNDFRERLSGPVLSRQLQQNGQEIAGMGAQGSDALTRVNEDLKRAARPLDAVRAPGSDTVANTAGNELFQRLLGHAPGGVLTRTAAKVGNLVYSIPQSKIQDLIVSGQIDPRLGASLLARRIPDKPNLTAGLLAQLLPISYGGLLGTMSAQ